MSNFFCTIIMVLVLILTFNYSSFAQCDINLSCTDDVFFSSDPPVFDVETNTIFYNNVEFGFFSCNETTYISGMVFYIYQLLPDGTRMNQCTVLGEAPFNVVGNVILDFGQSYFCETTIPIGTITLPPSEGFEACDGALLETEAVLYVTENTDIDVQNSSLYTQLPSTQYFIADLGTVEVNINNEFPGNGQPLTTAILRDFDTQEEGPQTLSCGENVELYVEGLSRLANCTPYDDVSTGIPSELINEFYYQINNGEPIIIADESTGAKGGQLSGPDNNLNGLCYAGLLNLNEPYVLDYNDLPENLCDGSEIKFTLKTIDVFTNQTAEDTYIVNYLGGCVVCVNTGCTDPCDPNFDPNAEENDPSACEGYDTVCDDMDCSTNDSYDSVACMCINESIFCPEGESFDDITCMCVQDIIEGCLDPCDPNYNPAASVDTDPTSCAGYDRICDDMDCTTIDAYDDATCSCSNTPDSTLPLECDDGDCSTIDVYDEETCSCSSMPDPDLPLDCDDGDCGTNDFYNSETCACEYTPIEIIIFGDDCEFTDDIFDPVTCTEIYVSNCPEGTSLDIINCECIIDEVDGCTDICDPNYDPASTNDDLCSGYDTTCNDNDCSTIDQYDFTNCVCTNTPDPIFPLDCDDNNCNTEDSYDSATCSCVNTEILVNPDDGCEFTDDSYDSVNCIVSNVSNCITGTTLDLANCVCVPYDIDGCTDPCDPAYNPASTNDVLCEGYDTECDDGNDCTFDEFDESNCSCLNLLPPTIEGCECSPVPNCPGCTNPCATNYDPFAQLDDDSCIFPNPDDGCDITIDTFNEVTCEVVNTPMCNSESTFNSEDCVCESLGFCCSNPCGLNYDPNCPDFGDSCTFPDVDDNCDLTIDTIDLNTCEVINTANCPDGTTFNSNDCLCESVAGCTTPPQTGIFECE